MTRLVSAFRLTLCLPPVWFALAAVVVAVAVNGWQPFVDIVLYALQRLSM